MTGEAGHSGVLAGVDGCRAGWIAVVMRPQQTGPEVLVMPRFDRLLDALGRDAIIAVDMPIGLPDRITGPGRGPEQAVRPFLGARQSSVFSIPSRLAVEAETYGEACRLAQETSDPPRKVSRQAFHLFAKIREIDMLLAADPGLRRRLIECHPEFAFCRLNGMTPMATPKKIRGAFNPEGIAERIALLARCGLDPALFFNGPPRGAAMDDLVDAAVNMLMAGRHARGMTQAFPSNPACDRHGIMIAIHG